MTPAAARIAVATTDDRFLVRLTSALLRAGSRHVRPVIRSRSRTLAAALQTMLEPNAGRSRSMAGRLFIPHYWAVYVHDGRGAPVLPRAGSVMVWFRNPNNDPRLRGGRYPERASQVRRLTRTQFEFWLAENRLAIQRGVPPPMIVTKRINTPTQAYAFFDNRKGMAGFVAQVPGIVAAEFSDHVLRMLDADGVSVVDETVTIRL